MGFFTNLYLADYSVTTLGVECRTEVYAGDTGARAYFSFGSADRPQGLHIYADGIVACDRNLPLLPAYPAVERASEDPTVCLIEGSFVPRHEEEPTLFCVRLPARFRPNKMSEPLEQPSKPFVLRVGDRIAVIYAVNKGGGTYRFWSEALEPGRSMDEYQLERMLVEDVADGKKIGFELNLGVFKVKVE